MEIMSDDGRGPTARTPPPCRRMGNETRLYPRPHSLQTLSRDRRGERRRVGIPYHRRSFRLIPFRQLDNGLEHIALLKGDISGEEPLLVRVHSSCATGDIFGSLRCECGEQLHQALKAIDKEGRGDLIYPQPRRARHRTDGQDKKPTSYRKTGLTR